MSGIGVPAPASTATLASRIAGPAIWFAFVKLASAPVLLQWAVLVTLSAGLPVVLYHLLEAPSIDLGRSLAEGLCRRLEPSHHRLAQAG